MLTANQLLSAADQLPDDQLEELVQQVAQLAAKRRAPSLPSGETELLRQINQQPDPHRVQRYQELRAKRENVLLDEAETQELLALSDWLEETHAERLQAVAGLAQLRGLSLNDMMTNLAIRHLINGES